MRSPLRNRRLFGVVSFRVFIYIERESVCVCVCEVFMRFGVSLRTYHVRSR